ncbi:MAG TPA: hypothetical protein VFQ44_18740 [Streptosporangiaceae bacterium]|nr:hypothetical protein [Streptosporangiaceae bacterium]
MCREGLNTIDLRVDERWMGRVVTRAHRAGTRAGFAIMDGGMIAEAHTGYDLGKAS